MWIAGCCDAIGSHSSDLRKTFIKMSIEVQCNPKVNSHMFIATHCIAEDTTIRVNFLLLFHNLVQNCATNVCF